MHGYPSQEPCRVCSRRPPETGPTNFSEPRFGYIFCTAHSSVPPAHLTEAEKQYKAAGRTTWDRVLEKKPGT